MLEEEAPCNRSPYFFAVTVHDEGFITHGHENSHLLVRPTQKCHRNYNNEPRK